MEPIRNVSDAVTGVDVVTDRDVWPEWQIRGAQVALVTHHDDAPTGYLSGKGDHTRQSRSDALAGPGPQIGATMAGPELLMGLEGTLDGCRADRPLGDGFGLHYPGGSSVTWNDRLGSTEGTADGQRHHSRSGESESEGVHVRMMGRPAVGGHEERSSWGQ